MERKHTTAPKVAAALAVVATLCGACLKKEAFPVEPAITLKSFVQSGDTLKLAINFTDGDGDIGLAQGDTFPPYDTSSVYYKNLFCDFQIRRNGAWTDAQSYWYFRVPVITPTGQNKALDGELAVTLSPFPGIRLGLPPIDVGDTVRTTVKLVDRALHESNVVTTNTIMLH